MDKRALGHVSHSQRNNYPQILWGCLFVAGCAIRLIPFVQIPTWLWIWAGVIVAIAVATGVATFAAVQEGHFIRNGREER